ncbi:M3 family oligoendopeptidase [Pontibacillus yanchengensis]|uniref:M3 family oligoendopeptidase n=2 Tax=Pontibacillus yanchengensis TaxID=462910 RepID=A0ACC7VFS5_9BACI|nr:M3 family oligoendopeptidase [Pontibacillus yanchengensis]MYL32428.1 M3 family oligoendopeptidase [Pontibacillus yanchengensis]MYL53009.1 M3 family oligoendopeptidase [Pontibacillus yanchengensis]
MYKDAWDLNRIFDGKSNSENLHNHISLIEKKVNDFNKIIDAFCIPKQKEDANVIQNLMKHMNDIRLKLSHTSSFITCLLAEDPKDQGASVIQERIAKISAQYDEVLHKLQTTLSYIQASVWDELLATDRLKPYQFILREWRDRKNNRLTEEEEKIISSLEVDGYHGWRKVYQTLVRSLRVRLEVNGEVNDLSIGQAMNLRSHEDGDVRKNSYKALERAWTSQEDILSSILNHIGGFRLQVYKKRGVTNILEEPLRHNRLSEQTLHTMWEVVCDHKKPFSAYLKRKATLLEKNSMHAYDFWAPINRSNQTMDYQEGVDFILQHFGEFGAELERFSRQAIQNHWVDAEDRLTKSSTAFCAGFPLTGESRVFMNYGGKITDVLTLAHELGHAFHNHAMASVEGVNKQYPMCVAETASTFAEMVVLDAALERADTKEEQLFLLDEKIKRSVMNFMNIHSRFLFEVRFYQERAKGIVSATRLNELMQEAIDEAYTGSLEDAPQHAWAFTPHFYITTVPFYNFPYTFGYLFAQSMYAKGKTERDKFEENYMALLRDSGCMSVEDLAMKHLGRDIQDRSFWEEGMSLCIKDVEKFLELTSSMEMDGERKVCKSIE